MSSKRAWTWRRSANSIDASDFGPGWGPDAFPEEVDNGPFVHLFVDTDTPVNTLKAEVMEELEALIPELAKLDGVEALFLWSSKERHFIAGADVAEIEAIRFAETGAAKAAEGQAVFEELAQLPFPTFGVIRGTCLGGGMELALALDYRIAVNDSSTKLGLPEINLGIIPGFGGCQRLPRLIGLRAALPLILAGSRLPAKVAYRKGMVDELIPPEGFAATAIDAARRILKDGGAKVRERRQARNKGIGAWLFEKNPIGRAIVAKAARKQVMKKTGGHYPAAPAAIDVVTAGLTMSMKDGLALEARRVGDLIASDVSKNLIAIFHDSEEARRLSLEDDHEVRLPDGQKPFVGVLGAGVMGAGVAELYLRRGHEVRLRDIAAEPLRRGLAQIGREIDGQVKKRRLTKGERDEILGRLSYTTAPDGFGRVDAVIEAIVEKIEVKKKALAELEDSLRPDALFLTNTSALSVTDIQSGAQHPERVVGLHFFNPVGKMPLVEIIPGADSAPWAVARSVALAQAGGKYPVVVQDSPGFLVNRLLTPYLDSACRLLDKGIPGPVIDSAARKFGLPMGPFRLLDEVGMDIAAEVAETLHEAFGERATPSKLLQRLLDEGWLGKKTGRGFYVYPEGDEKARPTWNSQLPTPSASASPGDEDIALFLVDKLIDEAARALEEEIIGGPAEVDLAMVMGTGFPPFRGGPLRFADHQGIPAIVGRLRERHEGGEPCAPSDLLESLGKAGHGFYSGRNRWASAPSREGVPG